MTVLYLYWERLSLYWNRPLMCMTEIHCINMFVGVTPWAQFQYDKDCLCGYRDSLYENKMAIRPYYLYNGETYTDEMESVIETALGIFHYALMVMF